MADSSRDAIDIEDVTCRGCNRNYDDVEGCPRLLPCLHVLCWPCLNSKMTQSGLTCPMCGENALSHDLNAFPADTARTTLVNIWKIKNEKEDECECGSTAKDFCTDCREVLCNDCLYTHQRRRQTKGHSVFSIERVRKGGIKDLLQKMTCSQKGHELHKLDKFCRDNSCQVPVCLQCAESSHACHEIVDLDQAYDIMTKDTEKIIVETKTREAELSAIKCKLDVANKELKHAGDRLTAQIDQIMDEYAEKIDDLRKSLKQNVKMTIDRKSAGLRGQREEIDGLVRNIQTTRARSEKVLSIFPPIAFCQICPTLHHRLESVATQQSDLKQHENSVLHLEYNRSRLTELTETLRSLIRIISSRADVSRTEVKVNNVQANHHSIIARIILRDKQGQRVFESRVDISAELRDPDGNVHSTDLPVYCPVDGSYQVSGTCASGGQYTLKVFLGGQPVSGQELTFEVVRSFQSGYQHTDNELLPGELSAVGGSFQERMQHDLTQMNLLKEFGQSVPENDLHCSGTDLTSVSLESLGPKRYEQTIPGGLKKVLNSQQVRDYINGHLKEKGIECKWQTDGRHLVVFGVREEEMKRCFQAIQACVKQVAIRIPQEQEFLVETDIWQTVRGQLETLYGDLIDIDDTIEKRGSVNICAKDDVIDDVARRISSFLSDKAVLTIRLRFATEVINRVCNDLDTELSVIQKSLTQYYVRIVLEEKSQLFIVRGIAVGSVRAAVAVNQAIQRMSATETDTMTEPKKAVTQRLSDVNSMENASDRRSAARHVEAPVLVLSSLLLTDKQLPTAAVGIDDGDKLAFVVRADITSLAVDVIVNAADPRLNHDGGLALAIVRKGGQSIQTECTEYVRQNGLLSVGDIYCSKSGRLLCDHVIHAVSPVWRGGERGERNKLSKAVQTCLEKASEWRARSIAFPALGAGTFKYPAELSTRCIVETVQNFLTRNQSSSVQEVYLCDLNPQTLQGFQKSCTSLFREECCIVCKV